MDSLDEFSDQASIGKILDLHIEAWDLAESGNRKVANQLFFDALFRLGIKIIEGIDRVEESNRCLLNTIQKVTTKTN